MVAVLTNPTGRYYDTHNLYYFVSLKYAKSQTLEISATTLQILIGATIAQISAMLIVIIRSVYSDTLNQLIMSSQP